jgi:putative ABC transport system permease protein
MKLIEFFGMALRSLWMNKLRTALTMLGIIIGVSAVITLMSVGQGAQAEINRTFSMLGANTLFVQPRNPDAPALAGLNPSLAGATLTMDDAQAIGKNVRGIAKLAPRSENFVEVTASGESINSVIQGSTPDYLDILNFQVAYGRFIADHDVSGRNMVVVLGSKAAEDLFGANDALGQTVSIKNKRFIVIGVLQAKGGNMFGFSTDNILIIPITTYQARLYSVRSASGEESVQAITIQTASDVSIDDVTQDIKDFLRKRHKIAPDKKNDFAVFSQQQAMDIASQVTGVFTIFLGAISGISLVVGGIGIMNIMLVSVTERTREIGLRKAIGAKRRDILLQFLFEAATLSLLGGGIGIAIGWGASVVISMIDIGGQTINSAVTSDIVILAISVSAFIGLVSGIYPALRASRLDPINALHYG